MLPIIDPQPCRGRLHPDMWENSDYWAEHKLHGCRYLLYSDGRLLSRHVSKATSSYVDKMDRVPQFASYIKYLPKDTILDGEVILHEFGTVRDVTSIINSDPQEAIRKQLERGFLSMRVFDLPYLNGEDLREYPLEARRRMLEGIEFLQEEGFVTLLATHHEDKKDFCDLVMRLGGEGVVLKHKYAHYGDKSLWVKVKRQETFDVFIIGYKSANELSTKVDGSVSATKFATQGWIGSVEIGMCLPDGSVVPVGYCSGFDEETREYISWHQVECLNRVIEIEAQSQLESGCFEHPRFSRWRDDKAKEDCVYER